MKAKEFDVKKRDPNWRPMQDLRRSGAGGKHKDKKKAEKQGEVKHKAKQFAEGVAEGVDAFYNAGETANKKPVGKGTTVKNKRTGRVGKAHSWSVVQGVPYLHVKSDNDIYQSPAKDWLVLDEQGVAEDENLELYGLSIGDTVTAKVDGQRVQGDIIDIFPDDMEVELLLRGPETGRTVVVDVRDTEIVEDRDVAEGSDWGEPREILEDVLRTLEREVEWPLTEVMDPKQVRQLLSPIVRAVNDKLLSMDRDGNQ